MTELAELMDGPKLYALYQCANDPYEFQRGLSLEQQSLLERQMEQAKADEQDNFNSEILSGAHYFFFFFFYPLTFFII
jgi:hypothetical protein